MGARASLELIARLGADRVAEHDLRLARLFCSGAGLPEPSAPIVRLETGETEELLGRLRRAGVRAAGRGGAVRVSFHFYNDEGVCVFIAVDVDPAWRGRPKPPGRYRTTAWIPGNFLAEGQIFIVVAVCSSART